MFINLDTPNLMKRLPLLFAVMAFSYCGTSSQSENATKDSTQALPTVKAESKVKFTPFNDVDKLRESMSNISVNDLRPWRGDELGWISSSSYNQIDLTDGSAMPNNIGMYLESEAENYVRTLKIVLNINYTPNKREALSVLDRYSKDCFKSLGLNYPKELHQSILKELPYKDENDSLKYELELERSNISTWKMKIESK